MVALLSSFIVEIEDHEDILHYTNNLYGNDNQQLHSQHQHQVVTSFLFIT